MWWNRKENEKWKSNILVGVASCLMRIKLNLNPVSKATNLDLSSMSMNAQIGMVNTYNQIMV